MILHYNFLAYFSVYGATGYLSAVILRRAARDQTVTRRS